MESTSKYATKKDSYDDTISRTASLTRRPIAPSVYCQKVTVATAQSVLLSISAYPIAGATRGAPRHEVSKFP
jgi:hypothetical protein